MDSSLSIKLHSESLISLDEWIEFTCKSGILTSYNFDMVVQGTNLSLQISISIHGMSVSILACLKFTSH